VVTVTNRGPADAPLDVLPTIWFRNTWTWATSPDTELPTLDGGGPGRILISHPQLGQWALWVDADAECLFTENETNAARLFGGQNRTPYVKDGIGEYVVHGRASAVNPARTGTKAAARHRLVVPAGGSATVRWRLRPAGAAPPPGGELGADAGAVVARCRAEADEFYQAITPPGVDAEGAMIMRRALAGMLWSKQFYYFDLDRWLQEHEAHPLRDPKRADVRNRHWFHMQNGNLLSMPDCWEYLWYAAWDLAFHCVPLSMVDPTFTRQQIELILSDVYLHPSGQIPAYEWNFGDVNPPVHAWATLFAYTAGAGPDGEQQTAFLRDAFKKLMLNFSWWLNRKDPDGKNLFEGGFLGLDNIGVFDRSAPLPTGGHLEQADGTAWMAMFSQNMLDLALILLAVDPSYEDLALRFVQHFFWIASGMDRVGESDDEMWDEEDGFFYDVLRLPDGSATRLRIRSMVGLIPLCAVAVIPRETLERFPSEGPGQGGLRALRRPAGRGGQPHGAGGGGEAPAVGSGRAETAPGPHPHARRGALPQPARDPVAVPEPSGRALCVHGARAGVPGPVPARRVRHRHVRRQLQLAWPGLVPDQPADRPGAADLLPLLRG
jgi:hypothetical protein